MQVVGSLKEVQIMNVTSSKVVAGCFAMSAFAVAILFGLDAGHSTAQVLLRAIIAMAVCYPAGSIVGAIGARVIREHVDNHKNKNPSGPEASDLPHAAGEEEAIVV
jgi:hypothetical protein